MESQKYLWSPMYVGAVLGQPGGSCPGKFFAVEGQLEVTMEALAYGFQNRNFHLIPGNVLEPSNCNSYKLESAVNSFICTCPSEGKYCSWLRKYNFSPNGLHFVCEHACFYILKGQMQSGYRMRAAH